VRGHVNRSGAVFNARSPSSGAARHLLPVDGEKGKIPARFRHGYPEAMSHTEAFPIATSEQRRALRRYQGQRLHDQAERILRAFEALPDPTTIAEAERMAKALKVIDAVVTQICGPEMRAPETHEEWAAEEIALAQWLPILDRRLAVLTPPDDAEPAPAQRLWPS